MVSSVKMRTRESFMKLSRVVQESEWEKGLGFDFGEVIED